MAIHTPNFALVNKTNALIHINGTPFCVVCSLQPITVALKASGSISQFPNTMCYLSRFFSSSGGHFFVSIYNAVTISIGRNKP